MSGAGRPSPCHQRTATENKAGFGLLIATCGTWSICLAFPYALPNWFPDRDLGVQHFLFPPPVSCLTLDHWDFFSTWIPGQLCGSQSCSQEIPPWSPEILFGKVHLRGLGSVNVTWHYQAVSTCLSVLHSRCWRRKLFFPINPGISFAHKDHFQLLPDTYNFAVLSSPDLSPLAGVLNFCVLWRHLWEVWFVTLSPDS